MKNGFNILVDAFWGSSGKGKLAAALADRYPITDASSSNLPNAGHTTLVDGHKIVTKVLPAACTMRPNIEAWISPNSAFWWRQLIREWEECHQPKVHIHNRAILMHEEFEEEEQKASSLLKIASTCQGAGAAQVARIQRRSVIVRDHAEVFRMQPRFAMSNIQFMEPQLFAQHVREYIDGGRMWLHEVSQGFALGLLYGTSYPYCTSRECSSIQAMADMGLPPQVAGDIYLNVRSFPIRVGNTKDGHSGEWWGDTQEVEFEDIMEDADAPFDVNDEYRDIETTTVTKRPRRFCDMSWEWLKIAAEQNGATKLALNFAQYIDWKDHQCKKKEDLSKKTRDFITTMEVATDLPVVWVGTGRDHEDQIWMD